MLDPPPDGAGSPPCGVQAGDLKSMLEALDEELRQLEKDVVADVKAGRERALRALASTGTFSGGLASTLSGHTGWPGDVPSDKAAQDVTYVSNIRSQKPARQRSRSMMLSRLEEQEPKALPQSGHIARRHTRACSESQALREKDQEPSEATAKEAAVTLLSAKSANAAPDDWVNLGVPSDNGAAESSSCSSFGESEDGDGLPAREATRKAKNAAGGLSDGCASPDAYGSESPTGSPTGSMALASRLKAEKTTAEAKGRGWQSLQRHVQHRRTSVAFRLPGGGLGAGSSRGASRSNSMPHSRRASQQIPRDGQRYQGLLTAAGEDVTLIASTSGLAREEAFGDRSSTIPTNSGRTSVISEDGNGNSARIFTEDQGAHADGKAQPQMNPENRRHSAASSTLMPPSAQKRRQSHHSARSAISASSKIQTTEVLDGALPSVQSSGPDAQEPGTATGLSSRMSFDSTMASDVVKLLPDQDETAVAKKLSSMENTNGIKNGADSRHTHYFCKNFEVLGCWDIEIVPVRPLAESFIRQKTTTFHDNERVSSKNRKSGDKLAVLRPNGPTRGCWDCMSMLLVLYDMIHVPLVFLAVRSTAFTDSIAWIGRLFWSVDICASFLTGYVDRDGNLVMLRRKIGLRYVRSFFIFDAMLVALDWLYLLDLDGASGSMQVSKTARALRLIRLTRLLRLVRIGKVVSMLSERIRSERFVVFLDIVKIVFLLLETAHVVACIWYGIGSNNFGSNGEFTWMVQCHTYAQRVEDGDVGHWYALSVHWSLSVLTGLGHEECFAQNADERVLAILVTFLAFGVTSYVVSALTSKMTQLHILASSDSSKLATLRRYLTEKDISQDLAMRVQWNAQHHIRERQQHTEEKDVDLLLQISEPLLAELHFHIYAPVLRRHAFFRTYCDYYPEVMTKVCHSAITVKSLSPGDVVFNEGEFDGLMYWVLSGVFQYIRQGSAQETTTLRRGDWASEASLWTTWMHRGRLQAKDDCLGGRLVVLDAAFFQESVAQFVTTEVNPKIYARNFVDVLNDKEAGTLSDVDPCLECVTWKSVEPGDHQEPMAVTPSEVSRRSSMTSRATPEHSTSRRFSNLSNLFAPGNTTLGQALAKISSRRESGGSIGLVCHEISTGSNHSRRSNRSQNSSPSPGASQVSPVAPRRESSSAPPGAAAKWFVGARVVD